MDDNARTGHTRNQNTGGFTLIELLIVVAIIAILAAIAVPNFMEAQARAKITRARADMRTIATAIESYKVDYQTIMGTRDWQSEMGLGQDEARLVAYSKMTTPVAYLTTVPLDPFETESQQERYKHVFQFQTSNLFSTNDWDKPRQRGYTWLVGSYGPLLARGGVINRKVLRGQTDAHKCFIYDSTNGTKSSGWIIRTNKGDMTTPDMSPGV